MASPTISPAELPDRPLRPPSSRARFGEARVGLQPLRLAARAPWLARRTRSPRDVILLPGFGTTDTAMLPLRGYLGAVGHTGHGWEIGRHGKDVELSVERFTPVLERIADQAEHRPVLIGWSLGGIVARETARENQDLVASVITLGSPLGGPRHTSASRVYSEDELAYIEALIAERREDPLTMPVTSIYSRRDGIVDWLSCVDRDTPHAENIEVGSTHVGYGIDPDVWKLVAERVENAPT
ncbi:MAG: alpha/beta fold hydrolase [Actinomycetota bacterium]